MKNKLINNLSKSTTIIFVFSALYFAAILLSASTPMFWDMAYVSKISNLIFDNNFSKIIFPEFDNGTPPLYSIYISILWKIFGKSLFICHIAILPFVIGLVYQFYKLSSKFLPQKQIIFALILLFIEPTILTQTILAGLDLVFCFLFLFGLNSVLENKRYMIALSVIAIPLLNSRCFTSVFSIFLIDCYINRSEYLNIKKFAKSIVAYLPALIFLIIWLLYHYLNTNWFAVSNNRAKYHHFNGLEEIFRNFIYIVWKIVDFGRVVIYIVVLIFAFKIFKSKNKKGISLIIIMLLSIIPYLFFFLPFSYPVSHRHFMIIYIIGSLTVVYFLLTLNKKPHRIIIYTVITISLIIGNFWLYPERFGNGWDSSLKSIPYFKLKEKFDSYIKISKINPADIGADFPMNFDNYDTYLSETHFQFTDIDKKPLDKFRYIVQSNISNNFIPNEINTLNNKWILLKTFKSKQIYIKLFKNPYK